jgi:predicted ATPase
MGSQTSPVETSGRESASSIRTPDQRLRVFISSTLVELEPERRAARTAIAGLRLTPVFFEAGARPYAAREVYRAYLDQSDVFIGIYWQSYGWVSPSMEISGLEEEYRLSEGKARLIYVKQPAPTREPRLQKFLDRIRKEDAVTYQKFSTPAELQELLANDVAQLLTERFARAAEPGTAPSQAAPLPRPRSPMIDRTEHVARAEALLLRDDVTLVTVTGTGGVGKTRLAIEVATRVEALFADGAAFISLSPVRDADQVIVSMAHALRISEGRDRPLLESLAESLNSVHLLLVMDNVEQLIATAAPQIAQILDRAPRLKVLTTSREPLRIRGEWTVAVPLLPVPSAEQSPDLQTLGQIPSVALFVRRASEVDPRFALTEDNALEIAEICRRLDGLPLALELAAARINVLPPKLLLPRLSRRLPVLTHGARDLPERQQTLSNVIAWSYDLLDPGEQRLFRSLAAFSEGFRIDGAMAIEGESPTDEPGEGATRRDQMLDRLESLVGKNLLTVEAGFDSEPRFFMLPTIQEYAHEKLEELGELAATNERFVHYMLAVARTPEWDLGDADRENRLQRLDGEVANLGSALEWCRDNRPALGVDLAGCLASFWLMRGYLCGGLSWLQALLAQTPATDRSHARARALFGMGLLYWKVAKTEAAEQSAEEALSIFRELGEPLWSAHSEWILAVNRIAQGQIEPARRLLDACLGRFREMDNAWGQGNALGFLGVIADIEGNIAEALSYYRDSSEFYRRIDDNIHYSVVLALQAGATASAGDREDTRRYFEELSRAAPRTRSGWALGMYLQVNGFNFQNNYRRYEAAKLLYQGSLLLWREIQRFESGFGIVLSLVGMAEIAAIQGKIERCGWLFGAADRLTPSSGSYRDTLNEHLVVIRRKLDTANAATFEAAWAEGQAATLEQAIDEALQER